MGNLNDGAALGTVWTGHRFDNTYVVAACKMLGLDPAVSRTTDMVKSAFNAKVKANHPDNGGDGSMDMDTLKKARDLLTKALESPRTDIATVCGTCKGAGTVKVGNGFQSVECPSCHGNGEAK